MMNKRLVALIIGFCLILSLIAPPFTPVLSAGTGTITVSNSRVTLSFPQTMSFAALIKSNVKISDIRLRYTVDQMSFANVVSEGFVQFPSSTTVNASYDLDMRRFGGFPSGTTIQYWWVVKDASQALLESVPVTYRITDNRYSWKNLSQGKINLFWYQGDNTFAQTLMDRAQTSLKSLAADTGATPEKQVNIYIYANSQDLQGSMIYPSEWTGGVSFFQYNIITIGISPSNLLWGEGAMTHELTHNVIGQVVYNPYDDLPVWLNEGLAMHNQGPLTSQFLDPLAKAIRNDQLLSVKMISSPFSAYSDKANLSYAESYTLVDFLIRKYGSENMAALLKAFKTGNTFDGAFEQVLGFNLDGLNEQWQPWVKTNYGK
jgi:hypothetical protein